MRYTDHELLEFWLPPWSQPLRDLLVRLTLSNPPIICHGSDRNAPGWVRPLCVQRWVGAALVARVDRMEAQRCQVWRFGEDCYPRWDGSGYERPERRRLRGRSDDALLELVARTLERLLHVVDEVPKMVDEGEWTGEALGGSELLAQIYALLRRRHGATRAREMLRAELQRFVDWPGEGNLRAGD